MERNILEKSNAQGMETSSPTENSSPTHHIR